MIKQLICILFFAISAVSAIENSIIPEMEKWESREAFNPKKYSTTQYERVLNALSHQEEKIRVCSYNVLFAWYEETCQVPQEERWSARLPLIVELLDEMQPDVMGVQELLAPMRDDLLSLINEKYGFYAFPSDEGEYDGIFYRKCRFEIIEQQGWRMTPDWGNSKESNALTMVQLKDFKTGKTFAIFNAHLAFSEIDKREAEAQFIANLLSEYQQRMPVILTGDLNTFPNRPDLIRLPAYDGDRVEQILAGSLKDAQKAAILGSIGPLSTFTNDPLDLEIKPFRGRGTPGVILDHIFVSDSVQVLLFAIQPGTIDGHFPSDHMPIIADCWLN